jgi:predicted nucleic acid-binding protein
MSNVVVDSSVLAKIVVAEADSDLAVHVVRHASRQGGLAVVLDIALVEVTNAVWKQYLRGIATEEESLDALGDLLAVPLQVEPALGRLQRAMEIAIQYRVAVYDALFVALTDDMRATAVTADEPLYNRVKADFPQIKLLRNWQ